jgi:hypothetical protein
VEPSTEQFESDIIQSNGMVIIPTIPGLDEPEMRADLRRVYQTLARTDEVGRVTPMKAQELMSAFNKAFLVIGRVAAVVGTRKQRAIENLKQVEAEIVLDTAPAILKAKGVRDSKESREAVCALDPKYQEAARLRDLLTALHEVFKHNMKSLEMSYSATKKVLGDKPQGNLGDMRSLLNGLMDENVRLGDSEDNNPFGEAKY